MTFSALSLRDCSTWPSRFALWPVSLLLFCVMSPIFCSSFQAARFIVICRTNLFDIFWSYSHLFLFIFLHLRYIRERGFFVRAARRLMNRRRWAGEAYSIWYIFYLNLSLSINLSIFHLHRTSYMVHGTSYVHVIMRSIVSKSLPLHFCCYIPLSIIFSCSSFCDVGTSFISSSCSWSHVLLHSLYLHHRTTCVFAFFSFPFPFIYFSFYNEYK